MTKIQGMKIIKKSAILADYADKRSQKTLSHLAVAKYPDYHTGSYYEIMYFHLN